MIIRPIKRENPYAQIDNRCLCDARLSWRARGILAYLLSKPPDWKVMSADIVNQGTEGRDAVRAAFKELAVLGYARLIPTRWGKEWHVFEEPSPENPSMGHALKKPTPEKANVGKSAPTNTDTRTKTEAETNARERLGRIYGRKASTVWSAKETKALRLVLKDADFWQELEMIERYYAKNRRKPDNICRRALLTLLNFWSVEVDRAREWCEKNPLPSERKAKPAPEAKPQEPEKPSEPIPVNSPQGKIFEEFRRRNKRLPADIVERDGFFIHGGRNGQHRGELIENSNGSHSLIDT